MEVYLASACGISFLASLLPRTRGDRMERGEPRPLDFASAVRVAPVSDSGGSKVEIRRVMPMRQEKVR
ncbi:hypothetical protein BK668_18075 [Pseudomonas fluorescens]|nr:hypothetical protein BK668_18075 [Pseudomonas fluorescens]